MWKKRRRGGESEETVAGKVKPGAGRPPRYKTRGEMEAKIEAYFKGCEGEPARDPGNGSLILNKWGEVVYINQHPPTVTGLALALGFRSRQALLNYQYRNAGFNEALEIAKARIQQYAEERLYDRDGCRGAQFTLQNNFKGWDGERRDGGGDIEDLSPLVKLLED